MKIFRKTEDASVLVLGLITSAVLVVGLASYISLVQAQNNNVMRSQSWNSAIPAAEAGIEDALTHLNTIGGQPRDTNGYVLNEENLFVVTRELPNLRYSVGINMSNQPTIWSTGYVRAPKGDGEISRVVRVQATRANSGMQGMVAINGITMNGGVEADSFDSENPLYSTDGAYDPTKRKDGSFVGSVAGNVNTGNGKIYGYMATGPNGEGNGNAGDFAWYASHSGGVQPGHHQKDFNAYYPPEGPPFNGGASFPATGVSITTTNYTYGNQLITTNVLPDPLPPGGVTSRTTNYTTLSYPTNATSGIVANTTFTSSKTAPAAGTYIGTVVTRVVTSGPPANRGTWYDFQSITSYSYPATVYSYLLNTTNFTTSSKTYAYALYTGAYQMNSLVMSSTETIIVLGNATLYVIGDISLTGQAQLIIAPGGSLKLYVGGATTKFAGGPILNETGDAAKFSYFGLPSNTSITVAGNASFTGTIYAPDADLFLNGGGNNTYDLVGATVTKTTKMNGHFKFHFDEKLRRMPGPIRYRVAQWNEI